ncbi:hypothetical protein [Nocardia sp. SSK8]|uniref:hypothetical protein n=1 Tax=Nocardia sp. SSK8 TaxID=3120154 RepID=UPI003008414C
MSDQETGSRFAREPDEGRFDAVERLRRKWEEAKAAEDRAMSNVVRLPRRPRRGRPEVGDPPPTRPVTRAELEAETSPWPAPAPADGNVIDLGASRRRRAGADAVPGRTRPRVMPRRVGPGEQNPEGDSAPPESPGR